MSSKMLLCSQCGSSIGILTGKEKMICCDKEMTIVSKNRQAQQIIYNPTSITHIPGVEVKVIPSQSKEIQKVEVNALGKKYVIHINNQLPTSNKFHVNIS